MPTNGGERHAPVVHANNLPAASGPCGHLLFSGHEKSLREGLTFVKTCYTLVSTLGRSSMVITCNDPTMLRIMPNT